VEKKEYQIIRVQFSERMMRYGACCLATGKLDVLRICEKVFEELAVMNTAKNTKLLDISSLHIATLMVYK
jgi:hypothetical protein